MNWASNLRLNLSSLQIHFGVTVAISELWFTKIELQLGSL
jgi:hypothetical protein